VKGQRLAGLGGKFPFHSEVRCAGLEDREKASDVGERSRRALMRSFSIFVVIIAWAISYGFQMRRKSNRKENPMIKGTVKASELNSFISIRACRAVAGQRRVISAQTWLAGVLILLPFPNAFAESDFSAFWKTFKSAVISGDKAKAAEMTKFPVSMPYGVKAVKNKETFLRRYNEIFKGETDAAQCFSSAEPRKESDRQRDIDCPFKETPDDMENAPIRFVFELTKAGWRFVGLDNVNE
jgi:hypothetical protein